MVVVHHLNNSRSQRILWLLEELGVGYTIERYQRDPATMLAPDALKRVHPLGKSPVVTHDGATIAESGAIVTYLVETFDKESTLVPERGTDAYNRYHYWLHYAEGSAMPPLFLSLVFGKLPERAPWIAKPLMKAVNSMFMKEYGGPVIAQHMSYWNDELAKHPYLTGDDFTAADVQMSFPAEAAIARFGNAGDYGHLKAWLTRVRARDAYQRALEKGGEYDLNY